MRPSQPFSADALRWTALVAATVLISIVVFIMTRGLLEPLALAAIAGAMAQPLNGWLTRKLGGRRSMASGLSLVLLLLLVILPLMGLIAVAVSQADTLAKGVGHLATRFNETDWQSKVPDWIPFQGRLEDIWPKILAKLGDLLQAAAAFFVSSLSSVTLGAASFFLKLFIFFYSLFFFLKMETPIVVKLLRFSGLSDDMQKKLNDRIMSISRATIKGTLVIAVIQGALGGLSFWAVGIPGAAFWAVVMMVMAVLPALGAPLILFGGAVYLVTRGDYAAAAAVAIWAAAVVSTIDNVLRPILVGRDARMHDVVILVSTLGGLGMFGASGMILGPVLAGLFVTIWTTLSDHVKAAEEAP